MLRFSLCLLLCLAPSLTAQEPAGYPKPRPDLRDTSVRGAPAPQTQRPAARAAADTGVSAVARLTSTPFVRNQTLLGVVLYGPTFAATVADRPVPAIAAYLVMAGGSFFAAAELARDLQITEGMELLATRAPILGAAAGAAAQYAMTGKNDYAAGMFFGSILGTTGALTLGRRLTTGAAVASVFGAEAAAGLAVGTMYAFDEDYTNTRSRAAVGAGVAVAGMQLGAMYGTYSRYNVTAGDVQTLWTTSLVGAAAGGAFVANGHPGHKKSTLAVLGGAVAGIVAGDRLLVRRIDHTRSEATLVSLGGLAGALMGGGVAVIVGSSDRFNAATAGLGAAGAAGGIYMIERWMGTRPDAGRRLSERLTVMPQALALAGARVPGTHSLVRFSF
ncbi:MAG: hypothetical protein HYV19_01610 [Gemmatimonadetes bacterium]|nr:hypothetical protein [Gemmatimonadota bacterium]